MIKTFSQSDIERFFKTGKPPKWLPALIRRRTLRKLEMVDAATSLEDLKIPPKNRLKPLKGDLAGLWSIRINDQWRITFLWEDGNAHEVRVVDYH